MAVLTTINKERPPWSLSIRRDVKTSAPADGSSSIEVTPHIKYESYPLGGNELLMLVRPRRKEKQVLKFPHRGGGSLERRLADEAPKNWIIFLYRLNYCASSRSLKLHWISYLWMLQCIFWTKWVIDSKPPLKFRIDCNAKVTNTTYRRKNLPFISFRKIHNENTLKRPLFPLNPHFCEAGITKGQQRERRARWGGEEVEEGAFRFVPSQVTRYEVTWWRTKLEVFHLSKRGFH